MRAGGEPDPLQPHRIGRSHGVGWRQHCAHRETGKQPRVGPRRRLEARPQDFSPTRRSRASRSRARPGVSCPGYRRLIGYRGRSVPARHARRRMGRPGRQPGSAPRPLERREPPGESLHGRGLGGTEPVQLGQLKPGARGNPGRRPQPAGRSECTRLRSATSNRIRGQSKSPA